MPADIQPFDVRDWIRPFYWRAFEPDNVASGRVRVNGAAGFRTHDLLEDQDVTRVEPQISMGADQRGAGRSHWQAAAPVAPGIKPDLVATLGQHRECVKRLEDGRAVLERSSQLNRRDARRRAN